jgi:hypothetical protein
MEIARWGNVPMPVLATVLAIFERELVHVTTVLWDLIAQWLFHSDDVHFSLLLMYTCTYCHSQITQYWNHVCLWTFSCCCLSRVRECLKLY